MIIGSNFKLSSRKFLDARQQCESLAVLETNEFRKLYPYGFEVFCIEEGKWYQNVAKSGTPIWEERKGGVGGSSNGNIDISDIISDEEISSNKTWSSQYIYGLQADLEQLIINNEDYITEIEDRLVFVEGELMLLDGFDGSYDSLTNKPTIPSLDGYATETFVNNAIANAQLGGGNGSNVDLSHLATKDELNAKADKTEIPTKISDLTNDSNFISEIPSEYITEDELNEKGYLTEHQDISHLATKDELFSKDYNDLTNKPNIPSIEGLATEEYVRNEIANAQLNGGDTEVDLSGYATKDELNTKADNLFKADMNTVSALGGIPANTDLNNLTIQEVLTKLLYPYVQPTVSASLTYSPTGNIYEFGQIVNVSAMKITVTKKSEKITKVDYYVNGTLNTSLTDNVENGGTFPLTFTNVFEIKKSIANTYFQAKVTDASGKTVSANTVALNFYYPYYYGVINEDATITQDLVKGLTKQVVAKGNKTYTFSPNYQRILIAYPKSYGVLKSILDPNGFEQLATFTRTELTIVGLDGTSQSYYVYVNGASTNTNFTMKFNY